MRTSAGLLVYRLRAAGPEFLLAHPGGPLWRNKDDGAWSIPKGEVEAGEEPLAAARREFREETGLEVAGTFQPLSPIRQKGGKQVVCWAVEADLDVSSFRPGSFEMEWPPRSGRRQSFPEIDRIDWFAGQAAAAKLLPSQKPRLDQLIGTIASEPPG